jgi:hypothetical protein
MGIFRLCLSWKSLHDMGFQRTRRHLFFKGALMKDPYEVLLESEGSNVSCEVSGIQM